MKKIILTSLLALFSLGLTAQVTTNITVQPANPTNLSSIKIFTDMYFPSGGCSDHTQFFRFQGIQSMHILCTVLARSHLFAAIPTLLILEH